MFHCHRKTLMKKEMIASCSMIYAKILHSDYWPVS